MFKNKKILLLLHKSNLTSPKFLVILICLLFLVTKLYKISEIPASVYWDEASIEYNAYSVLKTGKDEWGQFLPIEFKAFGEYKLPVYIYSVIPFISIFGLNELAVRFPAVLFSLGVVIVSFFLAKKMTNDIRIGLLTSFFITISQWFFIISRTGFEATAGLFFYILGLYLFLVGKDERSKFLIFSSISFTLSLFSYNSFRIISLITFLILVTIYYKDILEKLKKNLVIIIITIIIFIMGVGGVVNSVILGTTSRLEDVGISILYNQKKYQVAEAILSNYLSHFNPKFLFFSGDKSGRSQQHGYGEINLVFIPFLILGMIYIFKKKKLNYYLPLILLLISPIPASITKESPHALRSISAVPFIAIISSVGVFKFASFFKKSFYIYPTVVSISLIGFFIYYKNFLTVYLNQSANEWQYPYKKIFENSSDFNKFDHVIISDKLGQPYIFALFYLKYDPEKFKEVEYNQTIRKETSVVKKFDKFIFSNIDFYQFPKGKSLIFAHPTERMDEINYKYIINNPDGSLDWYVYEYEK